MRRGVPRGNYFPPNNEAPHMKRLLSLTCLTAFAVSSFATADEKPSYKYEDDAWYDVSEWFDGNDYNPTDEAIGRWDDERFSYYDNSTSSDGDNDDEAANTKAHRGHGNENGYANYVNDDNDDLYENYSRYYDTDGDGLYNVQVNYADENNDGTYDSYTQLWYDSNPENRKRGESLAKNELKNARGARETITGTVQSTDMVNQNGVIDLVAQIKDGNGKTVSVNFGRNAVTLQVFEGDPVSVSGPMTKIGDEKVLMATEVVHEGGKRTIERSGRAYRGTVKSTRSAKMGGEPHRVATIGTIEGKMLTVDLGDQSTAAQVETGDDVSVSGVPIRMGDRVVLVATNLTKE